MDLICTDTSGVQTGFVRGFYFDSEIGNEDSNTFILTVPKAFDVNYGYMVAEPDSEFGGIITTVETNTAEDMVTWGGRTFRGMLEKKIVRPLKEGVDDYRTVSGNVATIINDFLLEFGLSGLFICDEAEFEVAYQFERYVTFLHGLKGMLETIGCIITMKYNEVDGLVHIIIVKAQDYSEEIELSNDYRIKIKFNADKGTVNHLVCLGSGELHERIIVDLYVDADGNISQSQTFAGGQEVVETYTDTSATEAELIESGTKHLKEIFTQTADFTIGELEDMQLEIGDVVGAREYKTGIYFKNTITKKIVRGYEDSKTTEYM